MTRSKKKWLREFRAKYNIKNLDDATVIEVYKTNKKLIHKDGTLRSSSFEGKKKVPFVIHRSAEVNLSV